MPGGLLNLIAYGNANVILNGNPTKTFFQVTYSKYTNFGLQKFRLDYEGSRQIQLSDETTFTFKIKRYAELLMDTYIVVTLPDIWSPIYNPTEETDYKWSPYEFKWIRNLGAQMISQVELICGSTSIQKYTGEYLATIVERDFNSEKKKLFYEMTGNVQELNDPAHAHRNNGSYPSAFYTPATVPRSTNNLIGSTGAEPSIRGQTLYIPINTWFTLDSRCAFPLVALQYSELVINVTLRPIRDLFQIRNIFDMSNGNPYIRPDFTHQEFQMYRFLQSPPDTRIDIASKTYENTVQIWNADVHLISTYCFLSKDEAQLFASNDQVYLVKDVMKYSFPNVTGTQKVKLETSGLVSNWIFMLQRDDVTKRNEWSNYSNWAYQDVHPGNIQIPPGQYSMIDPLSAADLKFGPAVNMFDVENETYANEVGLAFQPVPTNIMITGPYNPINRLEILENLAILFDGDYRENTMNRGIFDYVEKYTRTEGFAGKGIYCYNFCLNTNPFDYQPSGAINLNKFKNIEFEISTYTPPIDPVNVLFSVICDDLGNPVGVSNKQGWDIYQYNYNLTVYEERYNVLSFIGGNCGMLYAK